MEVYDWSRIPPEVIIQIFHHIPSSDIVVNIPLVCRSWRDIQHHLVQQLSFWWERLEQEGIKITRDHRSDLIENISHHRVVRLLKASCRPYKLIPLTFPDMPMQMIWQNKHVAPFWKIKPELVRRASVNLMYRAPEEVIILLKDNNSDIEDLDILFLQLSHSKCKVSFGDFDSYFFRSSYPADDILKYLTRDNVKCKMVAFTGYVKSINSLPNTIMDLDLAIPCNDDRRGIDPGISMIQKKFPNLNQVNFSVRPGTDVSHIQILPQFKLITMNN